ncbi:MAG: hypothetical protein HY543_00485 [Deltaproteobacteria bacterium]|nr:hypothetical protein [Deltaproteobacteria bacterium]
MAPRSRLLGGTEVVVVPPALREVPAPARFDNGVQAIASMAQRVDHHFGQRLGRLRTDATASVGAVRGWANLADQLFMQTNCRWREVIAAQDDVHRPFFKKLFALWGEDIRPLRERVEMLRDRLHGVDQVKKTHLDVLDALAWDAIPLHRGPQAMIFRAGPSRRTLAEYVLTAFADVSSTHASDRHGISFVTDEAAVTQSLEETFPFAWPPYSDYDPYLSVLLRILGWSHTVTPVAADTVITRFTF